jgi:ABC-type branched-subunit amino acid transport system substrate-binding protein
LSEEEKEAGVALVDIGGGTTDITIFQEGIIRHTAVVPFGGDVGATGLSLAPDGALLAMLSFDGKKLGGSAVEGHYFSNHYSPDDPNPRIQKFIADYKAAFGSVPDSLAALGYDAAMVAFDAIKRAPSFDRAAIRDAIAATKNFPGVTGTITLDDKRNATKPAVVLEVGKGKTKYVATIAP